MSWANVVAPLAGYLIGSVPTAYLVARRRHGVDIREIGSGNVGGSNMRAVGGVWGTILVGVTDLVKGAVAVWAVLLLGLGEGTAGITGMAVVAGHNWPVWLGFRGGRGAAATLGVLLVLFPLGFLWVLLFLAVGRPLQLVAVLHVVAVVSLSGLAVVVGEPASMVWLLVALALLMVIKRLEANQRFRVPTGTETSRRVLANRLLLDRDQR
ncbi:MAG: glycerol-3-phosphate acyltransferase [Gaiellales bacterium]|nr:glycerol-3-phosphate acyltransferase [Gaiellales bacterium]